MRLVPTLLVPNAMGGGLLATPGEALRMSLPRRQSEIKEMIQRLRGRHLGGSLRSVLFRQLRGHRD